MSFPKDFVWGAATSACQIEGNSQADGKGRSIWDAFVEQPGKIFENHRVDPGCDHYRRWAEDVDLMRALGLRAYRCSIAWTRLLPDGVGRVNERGVEFYDRLIDRLLAAGIVPWLTLYHWDLPEALQRRGGFLNRDIVDWFGDYAALAARRFGDRVKHWITFNEPPVIVGLGHQDGVHAPGLRLPFDQCLLAAHHLLMAHGRGVQALRQGCAGPAKISLAQTSREPIPIDRAPATMEAARRAYFACTKRDFWNLAWWADPIVLGHYPEEGLRAFADALPAITDADLRLIAQPIDFLAYNCYSGWPVSSGASGQAVPQTWPPGNPRGTLPWLNLAPDAAYWAARFQTERYRLPLVFSENGYCNTDFVHRDGAVPDPQRIDFMARYLGAIERAVAEGVPVHGYFYWSLLDNFEWAEGYKDRFGLVHVDYATQQRTPKSSYFWYRDWIAAHS